MIHKFITIDDQVLMPFIGHEITIVQKENPSAIVIKANSIIANGKLMLKIEDSLLDIIIQKYTFPFPLSFVLAIVLGDTAIKDTWKMQRVWEGCIIDTENFHHTTLAGGMGYIIHTLPIDFAREKRNDS